MMKPEDPREATAFLPSSKVLAEIREIKERLEKLEAMSHFIIEKHIGDKPLPDEAEAIRTSDELVNLDKVRKKLLERSQDE